MDYRIENKLGRFYTHSEELAKRLQVRPEDIITYVESGDVKPSITTVAGLSIKKVKEYLASLAPQHQEKGLAILAETDAYLKEIRPTINAGLKAANENVKDDGLGSAEALAVGTKFHEFIEFSFEGEPPFSFEGVSEVCMPRLTAYIASFEKLTSENNLQHVIFEETYEGNGFAGTLDYMGYFNEELAILDWKTGKTLDIRKDLLQVAAQDIALDNEDVKTSSFIHFRLDGTYEIITINRDDHSFIWDTFRIYVQAFKFQLAIASKELIATAGNLAELIIKDQPNSLFANEHMRNTMTSYATFAANNKVWSENFKATRTIGNCMKAIGELEPQTQEEWREGYLKVISPVQILEVAKAFAKKAEISEFSALTEVIIHVFDQTWRGYQNEIMVMNFLNSAGWLGNIIKADNDVDLRYGVDLMVEGTKVGYQVKPRSFFKAVESGKISFHAYKIRGQMEAAEQDGWTVEFIDIEDAKEGKMIMKNWKEVLV